METSENELTAAKVATVATIGPIHGVQTKPREAPVKIPPKNPSVLVFIGRNLQNFSITVSTLFQRAGKTKLKPKTTKNITAIFLIVSAGIPNSLTIKAKVRDAKAKLTTIPATIPLIRQTFPSTPLAKIIGKTGKTQGVKTVKIPDMNAIGNSKNMFILSAV